MPGSTSRNKRDQYMAAYGGQVSSPTGRSIVGHSHVPNFPKGLKLHGTQTGRMSGKVPQYSNGPSAWNQGSVIVNPTGQAQQINTIDFAAAELRVLASMFGDSMCGDCIRVKMLKEHDDIHRTCQLCGTVWPGIEPGNRRREAVEATRAARATTDRLGCA